MATKKSQKNFDELPKQAWIENYKFRLFVDLMHEGGDVIVVSNLLVNSLGSRKANILKLGKLLTELKSVTDKHQSLIEGLELNFEFTTSGYYDFIAQLYKVKREIEDMPRPIQMHGRRLIKGHSSTYLYELLNSKTSSECDWDWLKVFLRREISSKKFAKKMFKKLPANISLPTINEDKYDEKYWYKNLKKQNKHLSPPKHDLYKCKNLYLLICKTIGEDFKLARSSIV